MSDLHCSITAAKKAAKLDDIVLQVYIDPYAEYTTDQFGYCPITSIGILPHIVPIAEVYPDGTVEYYNGT